MPTSVTKWVPLTVTQDDGGKFKFQLELGRERFDLPGAWLEAMMVQDLIDDLKEAGEQRNESAV
jgi:hypothetical protein